MLADRYLILVGDETELDNAKTGDGLAYWARDKCAGQLRFSAAAYDLGLPDLTCREAVGQGARTLIVGTAPVGGALPAHWRPAIFEALEAGLDVAAGLHSRLNADPGFVAAARAAGRRLIDVREPPTGLPIGTGAKRRGKRLLTVGTDCALGKKYTALCLARAMQARGRNVTFRATGQTGIMIAGEGISIDAVVADFVAGAAETLSPDNNPDHWDVIEGQGSLLHPSFAGVSLGLLHGSQPDAIVLCHEPTRTELVACPGFDIPPLTDVIDLYLQLARRTNPSCRCVGVSLNSSGIAEAERDEVLRAIAVATGLPAVDPLIDGIEPIIDHLLLENP